MDTGHRTDNGQADTGQTRLSVPEAVRGAAALLWVASAVWTTFSVHHVIEAWVTSAVVTVVIESAYGLATVWFHSSRSRLSAFALVVSLAPVVAALAYADVDMFGPVGAAFAFGPVIAECGFLLAAHLRVDPAALTAEQRAELAALKRNAAHEAAWREANLAAELAGIKADATRQMALDTAEAETRVHRNDLARRLSMSAPLSGGQTDRSVVSDTDGQTPDKVSGQVKPVVRPAVKVLAVQSDGSEFTQPAVVRPVSVRLSAPDTDGQTDTAEPKVVRLSGVRSGGLSGAVVSVLTQLPDISNEELTRRVSELLGTPQNPASVARTRLRKQPRTA